MTPTQSGTERVEYRVLFDDRTEQAWEVPLSDPASLPEAERRMAHHEKDAHRRGRFNYRIQKRTVVESPWEDVSGDE